MSKKYWVYILLLPDGKRYVGCTTANRPERRGHNYRKDFTETCLRFGWENIQRTFFEVYSKEEMFYLERYLIAYYNTRDATYGYNLSVGGPAGAKGVIRSEESRQNYLRANREKANNPEWRKKVSESHLGIGRGVPKTKYDYLFPDGTIRHLSPQAISQHYTSKGIKVTKLT